MAKSASQMDIFNDCQKVIPEEDNGPNIEHVSSLEYWWCILFSWDEQLQHPFACYVLNMFDKNEIKSPWLVGKLNVKSRLRKLKNFSKFPGQTFSLFSKVPKGKNHWMSFLFELYNNYIVSNEYMSYSILFLSCSFPATSSEDRQKVLDHLNGKFAAIISSQTITMDAAYEKIVKDFPYNCGIHPLIKVRNIIFFLHNTCFSDHKNNCVLL